MIFLRKTALFSKPNKITTYGPQALSTPTAAFPCPTPLHIPGHPNFSFFFRRPGIPYTSTCPMWFSCSSLIWREIWIWKYHGPSLCFLFYRQWRQILALIKYTTYICVILCSGWRAINPCWQVSFKLRYFLGLLRSFRGALDWFGYLVSWSGDLNVIINIL